MCPHAHLYERESRRLTVLSIVRECQCCDTLQCKPSHLQQNSSSAQKITSLLRESYTSCDMETAQLHDTHLEGVLDGIRGEGVVVGKTKRGYICFTTLALPSTTRDTGTGPALTRPHSPARAAVFPLLRGAGRRISPFSW